MEATNVFDTVIEATGLPKDLIEKELKILLENSGLTSESLTLDELRQILTNYLQDILLEAKEEISSPA